MTDIANAGSSTSTDAVVDEPPLVGPGVHVPALDGLRGVAVAAVVVYHLWPDTLPGGWLGVGLFFTLSGFLVVGLLDDEITHQGGVDLGRFYRRRVRRLVPASLVTIAAVVVATALLDDQARQRVAEEGLAAVLQVANWQQITEPGGYGAIFDQSSRPLAHMWSLAIEEQFYLTVPLLLAVFARRRVALIGIGLALAVLSHAIWWGTPDAYLATPVRGVEILVGAALALAVRRRPGIAALSWFWPVAVGAGLVAVLTMTESGSWVFRGFPAWMALAWALLIVACLGQGPLVGPLSGSVVRWVGLRSYAIYLIHWPVIELTDWHPAVVIAVTLGLAEMSFRMLEDPIRRSRRVRRPLLTLGTGSLLVGTGCVVFAVLLTPGLSVVSNAAEAGLPDWFVEPEIGSPATAVASDEGQPPVDGLGTAGAADGDGAPIPLPDGTPEGGADDASADSALAAVAGPDEPSSFPVPDIPVVLVIGDSTGRHVSIGLLRHGIESQSLAAVDGAVLRCSPLIDRLFGWRAHRVSRGYLGLAQFDEPCRPDVNTFEVEPDVVLVVDHGVSLADHRRPDGTWASILDTDYQTDLETSYRLEAQQARALGAITVFTTVPEVLDPTGADLFGSMADPERRARYNEIIDRLADEMEAVTVLDLAAVLDESGLDGTFSRSDGVHLDLDGASTRFAGEVLEPRLREIIATVAAPT